MLDDGYIVGFTAAVAVAAVAVVVGDGERANAELGYGVSVDSGDSRPEGIADGLSRGEAEAEAGGLALLVTAVPVCSVEGGRALKKGGLPALEVRGDGVGLSTCIASKSKSMSTSLLLSLPPLADSLGEARIADATCPREASS